MKPDENLIHLKFDYLEAKLGKRDMLSSELDLLQLLGHIEKYKKLRNNELKVKEKIRIKIKSTKLDIAKIERLLPKIKIPKILQKKKEEKELEKKKGMPQITKYDTVEEQLLNIQKKLKDLEEN